MYNILVVDDDKEIVKAIEIYLEKNMIVNGKDQLDVMHDYIYFITDNGVWKVVNIKAGD